MKTKLLAALILAALAAPALAQSPATFPAAKRLLAGIHEEIGHLRTVYCGCPYVRTTRSGGDIDREACGLEARRNERRSDRVEWEHVVPASWFGSQRSCWKSGHALCGTKKGKKVKGRKCCLKPGVDAAFRAAHNDPHNLFPAGGEVNGDRSNHAYGNVAGEPRAYGACDFEVGPGAESRAGVRREGRRTGAARPRRARPGVALHGRALRGRCPDDARAAARLASGGSTRSLGGRAGGADRGGDRAAESLYRNAVRGRLIELRPASRVSVVEGRRRVAMKFWEAMAIAAGHDENTIILRKDGNPDHELWLCRGDPERPNFLEWFSGAELTEDILNADDWGWKASTIDEVVTEA